MEWSEAAATALSKLNDVQWGEKKKSTIIALVNARLAQLSEESVWELPDVCARKTYHEKWKKDALFVSVLDEVTTLAKEWHNSRSMRMLAAAAEKLANASPLAVDRLVEVMIQPEDLTNARLAAVAILDRAGMETAAKSSSDSKVHLDEVTELSDEDLRRIAAGGGA